ncbi:hypothetical protein GYMLUDRAFT_177579, partial [Collybiopsis luxurians FD-317 M1]
TSGPVTMDTTAGEIDIELWSKETPQACRTFLALAMGRHYDGVIFRRVVPWSLVGTGDKTGTILGGESFYGGMLLLPNMTRHGGIHTGLAVLPFDYLASPCFTFVYLPLIPYRCPNRCSISLFLFLSSFLPILVFSLFVFHIFLSP